MHRPREATEHRDRHAGRRLRWTIAKHRHETEHRRRGGRQAGPDDAEPRRAEMAVDQGPAGQAVEDDGGQRHPQSRARVTERRREAAQHHGRQRERQADGDQGDELAGAVGEVGLLVQDQQDRPRRPHDRHHHQGDDGHRPQAHAQGGAHAAACCRRARPGCGRSSARPPRPGRRPAARRTSRRCCRSPPPPAPTGCSGPAGSRSVVPMAICASWVSTSGAASTMQGARLDDPRCGGRWRARRTERRFGLVDQVGHDLNLWSKPSRADAERGAEVKKPLRSAARLGRGETSGSCLKGSLGDSLLASGQAGHSANAALSSTVSGM